MVWDRWNKQECDVCHKKATTRCTKCWFSWYCSKTCQETHWPSHKLRCGKKDGALDESIEKWIKDNATQMENEEEDPQELEGHDFKLDFLHYLEESKKEIEDIFKDEKKFHQLLIHSEQNDYFATKKFTEIVSSAHGKIIILLFPSMRAIINTYHNKCEKKQDGCVHQIIDKKQATSLLPESTSLKTFDEQKHWGLLIATLLKFAEDQQEQIVVHCLNYYDFTSS